jgi:hypothetical protein
MSQILPICLGKGMSWLQENECGGLVEGRYRDFVDLGMFLA